MRRRAIAGPSCADARPRRAAPPPARPRRNRRRSMVAMVRQLRPSAIGMADLNGPDYALSSGGQFHRLERKEADMESIISNLLARFEKGLLSRRELVSGLAMLAAGSTAAAAQEELDFGAANIDHVSIQVPQRRRPVAFTQKTFRFSVTSRDH